MKNQSKILYFLQEVAIVVTGVLIAVAIGSYKEKSENEHYLEQTLLAIENEIKLSKNDLDTVLNKHLNLLEAIQREIGKSEQTLGDLILNSGGLQVASIKNISLRFFIANKAELLDFKLISQLIDIEQQAEFLKKKIDALINHSYKNLSSSDDEARRVFVFLLSDVLESEESLTKAYSSFLKDNREYLEK
jgi:hypothetical protein